MAIYDKSGNVLLSAYNKSGTEIDYAYAKDGAVVYTKGTPERDYDTYTVSPLFTYPLGNMQAFAVWGSAIAQVRENYGLHIIGIDSQALIKEVAMDMGHGNSCQFSKTFYDVGDEFPMFYIRNTGVWVYRIVGTTSILIKKYSFPTEQIGTYVAGFGIDSENNLFYTASYTEGDYQTKTGLFRICVWNMSNETDNGDGTYSMQFVSSNDFNWFDKYEAIQGCCYHDGYLFVATGMSGNTAQNVVLVGVNSLEIEHTVSLGTGAEIEGCAWVDDDYMIIGQNPNSITYRKVVFADARD